MAVAIWAVVIIKNVQRKNHNKLKKHYFANPFKTFTKPFCKASRILGKITLLRKGLENF